MLISFVGFFKALGRGILRVLPFIGKALEDPVIKAVLVSKLGAKAVAIIIAAIDLFDSEEFKDLSNEAKHLYARDKIRADLQLAGLEQPSNSYLDVHIAMAVKKRRGTGELVAYEKAV